MTFGGFIIVFGVFIIMFNGSIISFYVFVIVFAASILTCTSLGDFTLEEKRGNIQNIFAFPMSLPSI